MKLKMPSRTAAGHSGRSSPHSGGYYRGPIAVLTLLSLLSGAAMSQTRSVQVGCLPPPVPPPNHLLGFSPDGRYILAQGPAEIAVLSVQPFTVLFRVPAKKAGMAQFSPDSQQVFFVMSAGRVASPTAEDTHRGLLDRSAPYIERWSIADRAPIDPTEIRLQGCSAGGLSPDARALICVDSSGTLRAFDVASGQTVFEKAQFGKRFVRWEDNSPDPFPRRESGDPGSLRLRFSPDGRFFVALPVSARGSAGAFDLRDRKAIVLAGELKRLRTEAEHFDMEFTFVAADRLIMSPHVGAHHTTVTAAVVGFPSGEVLSRPKIPVGNLLRATDPHFVVVLPRPTCYGPPGRTAAVEFGTGQAITTDASVLDVFDSHYVAEPMRGELCLYERGNPAAVATVRLDAP